MVATTLQILSTPGIPVLPEALGDVIQDGTFNLLDVLRTRDSVIGLPPAYPEERLEADLNNNGANDQEDIDIAVRVMFGQQGVPHVIGVGGGDVSGAGITMLFEPGDAGGGGLFRIDQRTAADIEDFSGVDFSTLAAESTYFMTGFKIEA